MYQVRIKYGEEWLQWSPWSSDGNSEAKSIIILLEANWKKVTIKDDTGFSLQYRKAK